MNETSGQCALFDADEPAAFDSAAGDDDSPFVIVCDHAGRRLPRALGSLGLSDVDLISHIAWDIGIEGVARRLAKSLRAFLILQIYSRLVIDCNRPLSAPDSIARSSAGIPIPGNQSLSPEQVELRVAGVFRPYHEQIEAELLRRDRLGLSTIVVAMHSFTPVFMGTPRPWHTGVLYNRDVRLATPVLQLLRSDATLVVGDNQPYSVHDLSDYSIVQYGEKRGHPHVEVEIRQDLIAEAAGQESWAERLACTLLKASEPFRR